MSHHERLVQSQEEPCPYLPDRVACMPLRWQLRAPSPEDFDLSLAAGDRRVGQMLYRTQCPSCNACEPIRVPVNLFHRGKSQRRVWNKNQDLTVNVGPATFSHGKLQLYNRHKIERGLSKEGGAMGRSSYEQWFLRSCARTAEFRYFDGDSLIGVSIVDFGRQDVSSVYFYFDPDVDHRSLGTFSALYEIDWLHQHNMRFYYLGLFVEDCRHLSYKQRFYPHERLQDGIWQPHSASSRKQGPP